MITTATPSSTMDMTAAVRRAVGAPPATRRVSVAATQFRCVGDAAANLDRAECMVREAASRGAQVILLQELFAGLYFCKDQREDLFDLAAPASVEASVNPVLARFAALAKELAVVLPISFFERAGKAHFNSIAILDADGACLGVYRKSHIPTGPGYQEKLYFNPGDTGFKVFHTKYAAIGVAICWDQWFPEAARAMALLGAELLLYPTAIGSEPQDPTLDSREHWQRVMQGHAAANLVPVIASNRWGTEHGHECSISFYGRSFIADHTGAIVAQAPAFRQPSATTTASSSSSTAGATQTQKKCYSEAFGAKCDTVLVHSFDLSSIQRQRGSWGLFRDRRPDLYGPLLTLDGGKPRLHQPAGAVGAGGQCGCAAANCGSSGRSHCPCSYGPTRAATSAVKPVVHGAVVTKGPQGCTRSMEVVACTAAGQAMKARQGPSYNTSSSGGTVLLRAKL